jgi:hypothetical protein
MMVFPQSYKLGLILRTIQDLTLGKKNLPRNRSKTLTQMLHYEE